MGFGVALGNHVHVDAGNDSDARSYIIGGSAADKLYALCQAYGIHTSALSEDATFTIRESDLTQGTNLIPMQKLLAEQLSKIAAGKELAA